MIVSAAHLLSRASFLSSALLSSTSILLSGTSYPLPSSAPTLIGEQISAPSESLVTVTSAFDGIFDGKERDDALRHKNSATFRTSIASSIASDPTIAGPLLRLAFHDAATREDGPWYVSSLFSGSSRRSGGANGSSRYEIDDRYENRALSRPLRVVEAALDDVDPRGSGLSLADAIALAGATAVEVAGGPRIEVRLGRPDQPYADPTTLRFPARKATERSRVETTLPSAGLDSVGLRLFFGRLGLSEEEFVALCGAHDLGRHVTLTGMSKQCLKDLTRRCLEDAPVLVPFVTKNPDTFSNSYFSELLRWYDREVEYGEVQFIPTDVALVVDDGLRQHVSRFAKDEALFFRVFSRSYQKLVDANAKTIERY